MRDLLSTREREREEEEERVGVAVCDWASRLLWPLKH
jgi:hypothetical protein